MSGYTKATQRLCRQVLKIGGERVASGGNALFDLEKDATRKDWKLRVGSKNGKNSVGFRLCKSIFGYKMQPSHCHHNAAIIAHTKGWEMWTGLALSADGIWRVHSWAVAKKNGRGTGRLYETTMPRILYYGCKQDEKEVESVLEWG
jgi:hypothetical protein